jgi:uncharacterized protein YggU (UPF0235/DUF167 family)
LRLLLSVTPGASRDELVGRHGEGWKARVTAAPERGRANDAVIALLAGVLRIDRGSIRVVAGHAARRKVVEIDGLDEEEAGRRLDAAARR